MLKKPKPRNHGTMTEAAFKNWIIGILRNKSRMWKPTQACKKAAERKYVGDNKRRKYVYECNVCKGLFPSEETSVDHIIPLGTFTTYDNLINALFCEVDNLQLLCNSCHDAKSAKEGQERTEVKRKLKDKC